MAVLLCMIILVEISTMGIEKTKDTSVSNLCSQYSGYENFYFQKL